MQIDTVSGGVTCQAGRVMIVEDMQANGTLAHITDILQTANPHSFMNMNNRERFKVHYDKVFPFGIFNATATQAVATQMCETFEFYKRCNIPMVFEGTTNGIGSISAGALLLVFVGSLAAGTNDTISPCITRCRFIDG